MQQEVKVKYTYYLLYEGASSFSLSSELLEAPEYNRESWHAAIRNFIWSRSKEFAIREDLVLINFINMLNCYISTVNTNNI